MDDLAVLVRDRSGLKETPTLIEKEANKRDRYINEHETKYVTVETKREQGNVQERQIRNGR